MNTDVKIRTEGTRTYLEGIQPGFWEAGEMCEFASAFTCTLACVGEDVPYHYVLGVTGVAFRFTFGAELWNPGFYGFAGVAADVHDLVRRAFAAVGYAYRHHTPGDCREDLRRIRDSIDRSIAVMLKGHVVDASDWVLITGCEGDGDVLLGISPYGGGERFGEHDIIREWHLKTQGHILLGEKGERPPAADIYTDALRLAVDLVRTPQVDIRMTGLHAYAVLASALRDDEFTEDTLGWRYLCLLCYNMMLDDHRCATPFLNDAAGALPRCAAHLLEAAGHYERSCELRNRLKGILPSNFSEEAQKRVLDANVRDEYARVLLEIRDVEETAISCIERALAVSHE